MTTRTAAPIGAPCWVDRWTSDVDGSRGFHSELFGWEAQEPSPEFGGYFMFSRNGLPAAGAMGGTSGRSTSPPTRRRPVQAARTGAVDASHPSTSGKEDVMQRITPHLWFDTQAREAAELYTSVLDGSEIVAVTTLRDTPSGDADLVSFTLAGQPFMAIGAGPLFRFNPSVSFRVDCESEDEVDSLWRRLGEGGEVLMPLGAYPFSQRYGWLQDRYGLSWQVMHSGGREVTQKIVPTLMFTAPVCGRAEEAIGLYTSVFGGSVVGDVTRYGSGEEPETEGTVRYTAFTLDGMHLAAMDSARSHGFTFNEAISLMVLCDTQEEIDHYWERLSAVPEAEQCGWLKDRYGLSWQVAPRAMQEMLQQADEQQMARVTRAFLGMKKFDLAQLEEAYAGR